MFKKTGISREIRSLIPLQIENSGKSQIWSHCNRLISRCVLVATLLVQFGLSQAWAQDDGSDPPVPPPLVKNLNLWQFDDTNLLGRWNTFPPKTATNLSLVASWETNAVELAAPGAVLQYRVIETNGAKNFTCDKGSIYLWVRPYWSSGVGPGSYARLFELGNYTTNSSIGWLSMYFDTYGSNVFFSGQTKIGRAHV